MLKAVEGKGESKLTFFPPPITQSYKINKRFFKTEASPMSGTSSAFVAIQHQQNRILWRTFFWAFKARKHSQRVFCDWSFRSLYVYNLFYFFIIIVNSICLLLQLFSFMNFFFLLIIRKRIAYVVVIGNFLVSLTLQLLLCWQFKGFNTMQQ